MKDTQARDTTALKQPFTSWSHPTADVFRKSDIDTHPFRKAPAPSALHAPEILSGFTPEPLLAITPEKSLGRVQAEKSSRLTERGEGDRKGRQRVRFAPDTRSSPPSQSVSAEIDKKGKVGCEGKDSDASNIASEEEWMPRSFSAISQKLYQPGRYTDNSQDSLPLATVSDSSPCGSSGPKRYTVETQGDKTVYVPIDRSVKNITSQYRQSDRQHEKPVTSRIVRHTPANTCEDEASETHLKAAVNPTSCSETFPGASTRSSSSNSTSYRRTSPQRSRKVSPSRGRSSSAASSGKCSPSPSRSPGRVTPVEGLEFLNPEPEPMVQVIREAPYQPKYEDYVFPFEEGEEGGGGYDATVDNPLARPEFNSALKISQELKSVKGRRPDTWGVVSQTLKTSDRKRTEIQEKASSKVNFQMQSGLFSDLVEVDVPLDDLCQSLEKDIRLRAPSPKLGKPSTVKAPVGKEPDLMEFFTPDLQQEFPDLTLTGVQPVAESFVTADPMLAFDLYRHNRAWSGLTDS